MMRLFYFSVGFFCSVVSPFASEGVIYPAAFPLLVTKCGADSVSCLWVLLWLKSPTASHTSSDIDTVPPQRHGWHLIALGALFEFLTVNKGSRGNVNVVLVWGASMTWGRMVKYNGGTWDRSLTLCLTNGPLVCVVCLCLWRQVFKDCIHSNQIQIYALTVWFQSVLRQVFSIVEWETKPKYVKS